MRSTFAGTAALLFSAAVVSTVPRHAAAQNAPGGGLDDPTIVAIFDVANTYDIETGSTAARKARSKEVREFGRMLARDHEAVRKQGRDLAKRLGVTPTPPKENPLAADHAHATKELRTMKGAAFDREFLEHEVAYHNMVIDAVQKTLMPAIQNADLKALVEKVAPAFVAHRDKAKQLLDTMK